MQKQALRDCWNDVVWLSVCVCVLTVGASRRAVSLFSVFPPPAPLFALWWGPRGWSCTAQASSAWSQWCWSSYPCWLSWTDCKTIYKLNVFPSKNDLQFGKHFPRKMEPRDKSEIKNKPCQRSHQRMVFGQAARSSTASSAGYIPEEPDPGPRWGGTSEEASSPFGWSLIKSERVCDRLIQQECVSALWF